MTVLYFLDTKRKRIYKKQEDVQIGERALHLLKKTIDSIEGSTEAWDISIERNKPKQLQSWAK